MFAHSQHCVTVCGEPTNQVEKIDDPSDNLFVFFPEDTKVGVKPIRKCVDQPFSG